MIVVMRNTKTGCSFSLFRFIILVFSLYGLELYPAGCSQEKFNERFEHSGSDEDSEGYENTGRIVGGWTTNITEYPYQTSLQYQDKHICGASIISNRFIITAAHCTHRRIASNFTVRVGSSFRSSGGRIIEVDEIFDHPGYSKSLHLNDLSLLKLKEDLEWDETIQPIALPDEGDEVTGNETVGVVTGWGRMDFRANELPEQLRVTYVPLFDMDYCEETYTTKYIDRNKVFCAGSTEGGIDTCQGDSGGPLAVDEILYGVTSWGYQCATPGYPGVYSSTVGFRTFINEITGL